MVDHDLAGPPSGCPEPRRCRRECLLHRDRADARLSRVGIRRGPHGRDLLGDDPIADADQEYGLGIVLRDRDGSPEYWHNGALAPHGFNTHISTFPTWDTTVTVLVARDVMVTNATRVGQRLIDA